MSPSIPPNGGVFVIQFCDIDGRNAPNFEGGGSEFFLSGLQVSGRLGWGRSFDATAYDDWITTVIASKNEWRDGNARFRRSQQMGRRGLTAPAARWLVDGSVPARSERRVAAVFLVAFAALLALVLPAQGQTGACSRTPEVRDAIVAETGAAACSSVTSTQLASITYLEIEDYSSANIVPADFAGLTTPDVLAISRSPALTTVPANAFSEVTSLTALSLEENSISSVHADAFNGLSARQALVLFNNYIKVLEDGIFTGMDALYEISMQHNLVSVPDEDTFAGAPNLSIISPAFNRVSSVHKDTFAGRTDTLRV